MITFSLSIMLFVTVAADSSQINTCYNDTASLQLVNYKEKHEGCVECVTTSSGAPVDVRDTTVLNGDMMRNTYFVEDLSNSIRRRIPERIVHAKGSGAFGYFQVTHNITQYCKAKMFSQIGKRTPLFVRFSHGFLEKGSADTLLDVLGVATKFYTEEGNFDNIALSTKFFSFNDPILFSSLTKAIDRNAATNLKDPNMLWDLIWRKPVLLSFFLYLFAVIGHPDGYIHTPGFNPHTYQVYNAEGKSYLVRWSQIPKCGVKNLSNKEATKIASMDPDYYSRQLYNAIAAGNYPTYTLGIQVITKKEIDEEPGFNFFDVTKLWPESKYPVLPVGDIVLDKNPDNHFATAEQIGFCPGNVVPGMLGCPDNVFVSRTFAYKEAQRYRLGANSEHIAVNRPRSAVHSYSRDGVAPVGDNGRDGPPYTPNSYNGPKVCKEKNRPKMIKIKICEDSHNFDQIAEIYRNLSEEQRREMAETAVDTLMRVHRELQTNILKLLGAVDADLKFRVAVGLAAAVDKCALPSNTFSKVTVGGKTFMCPFSN